MKNTTIRAAKASLLMLILFNAMLAIGQVSVLTQHNDNARTGQNLSETVLNTSNVNQSSFGKLFWRTVDGFIYAQPLYVPGLTIQGATHNVVYVATQHNSVYAFDADDPNAAAPLWQVNLGTPVPSQDICIISGDTNPADCPYYDISPEIGITSTPVIDPVAGIIYVVNRTKNTSNSTYHDYLHALSLTTGAEELAGPVEITGQVVGTGTGGSGGVIQFQPAYQHQRPALLLVNGVLYLAFGSVGDIGSVYHGWVMSYNASTLQQEAIFNVTPDGDDGGIWSAGQGPVADSSGNVYFMTGNGDFNANTQGGRDYGDSFIKFSGSSLAVSDYFTPDTQATLNANNTDLGSGGPMLMPGTSLLVGMGKDGILRVVNSTNMGHYNSNTNNDVQELTATPNAFFSSPIYWNSPNFGPVIYIGGAGDYLKAFHFGGSTFGTTPVSQGTLQNSSGDPNAAALSISANGSMMGTGILWSTASISQWAKGTQVPGVVRAYDATNLATELWDSTQNLARDDVGNSAKFNPPTISNGKVYVGSFSGQLQVYGLNPPAFQGVQFVQVASATPQSTQTTVSVPYTGAQTAGDLNVVVVGWNDTTAAVQSVTDSAGNTYTLALGPTKGTGLSESIYYAKNILASTANTVTVTFNQGATKPDIRILEYSGVATSNPLDVSTGASGTTNVADSGNVNTNAANELIVGASMAQSNTTLMAGAPFTPRVITSPDSDLAADRIVNVPGVYHSWEPLNAAGNWVMQVVTFKSATASTVPFVSSVTPNNGPSSGGTAVTISGIDFAAGATVAFGGVAATNVTVVNSTTITATTPAGSAGAVTVTVTANGQSGSLAGAFTYIGQPTVTSVSPNSGPTSGGTAVTITGTNFAAGATVTFGSAAATGVTVVNSTTITATTPAGSAGAVTVTVTNPGPQSGSLANGFTYNGSVAISYAQVASATPQTASATVPVTFPGAQTSGDMNVVVVGWNDTTSTVQSVKDSAGNTYSLAIGPTSGTGMRQSIYYAANIAAGSNTVTVTFSQAAAYPDVRILEYRGVTTLDKTAGASGSSTSANSGAATTTSANELIFGADLVATQTGAAGSGFTSRIITSPDGDIAEDKIVTAAGSNSATATLTSAGAWVMQMVTFSAVSGPAPTVSSVSPNSGSTAGGTAVTITGTNFAAGATVTFGSTAATSVTVVNSTTITATTPAGSAGAATVTVTNTGGRSGSLASAFTYIAPPTVTTVSPNGGPLAGGTAVTITGTNFASGATVTFGTVAATGVTVVNSTTITATTPAESAGAVTVTVTNSNGLSGSLANGFTFAPAPTVSSVSPSSGPMAGGTAITITGTNFAAGATVTFGSTAATGVTVVNSTTITATTPTGNAGAVTVTVAVNGQSGSLASGYTFVVSPTVTSVSPNNGPVAGGTSVTITGTNFASGATVTFGSTAATNVAVVNSTTITATTPAGSAGAATVTVTANGQSGSLAGAFTYIGQPTMTSVSPNNGPVAGGTAVTITGTNFAAGATVTFGSTAATGVTVVSSTSITATTPAGSAGAVTVTVTNPGPQSGSLSNGFTYNASVAISYAQVASATPQTASATVPVTFPGAQTSGDMNVVVVGWNDTTSTVQSVKDSAGNTYSLAIGPTSGTGMRQSIYYAANIAAGSNTVTVTFSQAAAYPDVRILEYRGVTTLDKTAGASGSSTSANSGAATTTSANELIFGADLVATQTGAAGSGFTSRIITSPDGDIAEDKIVTAAGSNSATATLTSAGAWVMQMATFSAVSGPAPTVSSVSPNSGSTAGGTAVTITGTNFAAGATVTFGSTAATSVTVVNSTTITATTPAGSAGAATVTVTNTGGRSGSLASAFTYIAPPTVTTVSPNGGPLAGGTAVTITGTNFASDATVTFGTVAATGVTVVNSTTITATTPAESAGAVTVTVTNSNGLSGSLANGFTFAPAPTVTGVSPSSGPTAGGTAITITGTNFAAGATVEILETRRQATNVVVVNSTTITATTPTGDAGAVTVIVAVNGQSGSLASGYTYVVSPTVTSVSPNNGPVAGGTSVTITGTNFASGATVTFGSTAATNVAVVNSTTITATTPAGSAGAATVTVTANGQSGSLAGAFTYIGQPTMTSVSPNNGPVAGGTAVTITGTNFAAGATVTFGSTAATGVTVVSSTSITATTPAGSAGAVTVTVTNPGPQSGSLANGFTYNGSVAISYAQVASATPQTASATVPVTFPGAQTSGDMNVVVVGWNDTTSTVQSVKDSAGNTYSLAIGPTSGTGMRQSIYYAANIAAGSNTVTVTFSQAAAYPDVRILEYRGVTTLDKTAGASGSSTSANSGAATTTSANELIFGADLVATQTGAAGSGFTSRIITSPDGDIAEDKIVTAAGSNSATATLTSAGAWVMQMATFSAVSGPAPTVSSVSPNSGSTAGGTAVTITGTNFAAGATVTFGSTAATSVTVVNSTTITATTPAGSAGAATVTVTNTGGRSGSLASAFTYIAPPTVTTVSPNGGPLAGGTAVTITGTNFASGATVTFGTVAATGVTVVNSTTITATTPAGSTGAMIVTVTNSSGQSGSLAGAFTYGQPTVSSVSPNSGSTAGGTAVTITGTNFAAGATVTFGSSAATSVVVVNSTTITATTPAGSAGAVTVTVTNSGNQSGSLTTAFTYVSGSPTYTDNFVRANGSLGANWSLPQLNPPNCCNALQIVSDQVLATTVNVLHPAALYTVGSFGNNQYSRFIVAGGKASNGGQAAYVRGTTTSQQFYNDAIYITGSTFTYRLGDAQSNDFCNSNFPISGYSAGDTHELDVAGSGPTFFWSLHNGVIEATCIENTDNYIGGFPGLGISEDTNTTPTLADGTWTGGTLPSFSSTPTDNFMRPNAGWLGVNWWPFLASTNDSDVPNASYFKISGNAAIQTNSNGSGVATAVWTTPLTGNMSRITIGNLAGGNDWLACINRATLPAAGFGAGGSYYLLLAEANGTIDLLEVQGTPTPSYNLLSSGTFNGTVTTLELDASGANPVVLTIKVNGSTFGSTFSDSTYKLTGTYVGIGANGSQSSTITGWIGG